MSLPTSDLLQAVVPSSERRTPPPPPPAYADDAEHALRLAPAELATLCRVAAEDVAARYPGRIVEYEADGDRTGRGEWDPTRVAYAIAILLEDALERTSSADDRIRLRWREHGGEVVLRVQYPRPVAEGDQVVSLFEGGVTPDGADDRVGTLRLVVARKIVLQHGGSLARVRTRAGTTYVATLPRRAARRSRRR